MRSWWVPLGALLLAAPTCPRGDRPSGAWEAFTVGANTTCGIDSAAVLFCWGGNDWGQLGLGTFFEKEDELVATPRKVLEDVRAVSAGNDTVCVIRDDGSLWCWGNNSHGQVGDGQAPRASNRNLTPTRIGDAAAIWDSVDAGADHTCALRDDRSLWCWGSNHNGEVGLGHQEPVTEPTSVDPGPWRQVSAGCHTCAIHETGTLWCWGENSRGELGLGEPGPPSSDDAYPGDIETRLPVQVGTRDDWALVDAMCQKTCATTDDGALWCWGHDEHGALGVGDVRGSCGGNPCSADPVQVGPGPWASVSGESSSTCAVRDDGTLWCWGWFYPYDDFPFGLESSVPVRVGSASEWSRVAVHAEHQCALDAGGDLYCWGIGYYGALGTGDDADQDEPTLVR